TVQRARSVQIPDNAEPAGSGWSASFNEPTSVHRSVHRCGSIARLADLARVSRTNQRSPTSSEREVSRMYCAAQIPSIDSVEPLSRQSSPLPTARMLDWSGSATTAVAPAARLAISDAPDASAKFVTALAVAVLSHGPGSNPAAAASITQ